MVTPELDRPLPLRPEIPNEPNGADQPDGTKADVALKTNQNEPTPLPLRREIPNEPNCANQPEGTKADVNFETNPNEPNSVGRSVAFNAPFTPWRRASWTSPGALVLVTHDRYLLDRVSTVVMGLEGQGGAVIYSDYRQWEANQGRELPKPERPTPPASDPSRDRKGAIFKTKLSYMEAREWEQMETQILEAEGELAAVHAEMQSPDVVSDGARLQACYAKLQSAEGRVAGLHARWAELEAKQ